MDVLFIANSFPPNIKHFYLSETPTYRRVCLMSIIYSVHVLAATNSDPYTAVSTVAYFFEHQSREVLSMRCNVPVTDLPVIVSYYKFVSSVLLSQTYVKVLGYI